MNDVDQNDWQQWWDARQSALESVLGPSDGMVGHALIPFFVGVELGGSSDLLYFRSHIPGVVTVTASLIGDKSQVKNEMGNYELAICHRDDEQWGPEFISKLAYMTLDAKLEPRETIGGGEQLTPEGSTISAFLFADYGRFTVRGTPAGLLMMVGITEDELAVCRDGYREDVERALWRDGIWPYTDLYRESVRF